MFPPQNASKENFFNIVKNGSIEKLCAFPTSDYVNDTNEHGRTALHLAAKRIHEASSILSELLIRGARINAIDAHGSTALHLAVKYGTTEGLDILLWASDNTGTRADVNAQGEEGSTPLHLAVIRREENFVSRLLNQGADPSICDNAGHTPLEIAPAGSIKDLLQAQGACTLGCKS